VQTCALPILVSGLGLAVLGRLGGLLSKLIGLTVRLLELGRLAVLALLPVVAVLCVLAVLAVLTLGAGKGRLGHGTRLLAHLHGLLARLGDLVQLLVVGLDGLLVRLGRRVQPPLLQPMVMLLGHVQVLSGQLLQVAPGRLRCFGGAPHALDGHGLAVLEAFAGRQHVKRMDHGVAALAALVQGVAGIAAARLPQALPALTGALPALRTALPTLGEALPALAAALPSLPR